MPVRRRLSAAPVRQVNALSAFRWSTDGSGCDHLLGDPCFGTRTVAARAWEQFRRHVWAGCHRFYVPSSATYFDGLTTAGREYLLDRWHHMGPFDVAGTLAALAIDRANLARFAKTRAARQIDDYLDLFRRDLDVVDAAARQLAADSDELRPYPRHLNTAEKYGGPGTADEP